ncbi:MAG: DUF3095 family protein [Myxococcota bacterium]
MTDRDAFYRDLPEFHDFADVAGTDPFSPVPDGWRVVITDVVGSTDAIAAGRYREVNAMGVASIVALRNAVRGCAIPYVFGGDGATVLTPSSRQPDVDATLRGIVAMAAEGFGLTMRVGTVPVAELRADGFDISVAKYRQSPGSQFAMLRGSGVGEAERRVKDPHDARAARYRPSEKGPREANFEGFECRWRPVPSRCGQTLSVIVKAVAEDDAQTREATYRRVIAQLDALAAASGTPADVAAALRLAAPWSRFAVETGIRATQASGWGATRVRLEAGLSVAIGRTLLAAGLDAFGFPGRTYRDAVVVNCDERKFDDVLRAVVDVDERRHRALRAWLEHERQGGALDYGIHASRERLLTCAIGDYRSDHVHFVDGADGGYALAARELKAQMRRRRTPRSR